MYTAVAAGDDMQVCHAESFRLFKQAPGRSEKVSPGAKELLFYVLWAKSGRYNLTISSCVSVRMSRY